MAMNLKPDSQQLYDLVQGTAKNVRYHTLDAVDEICEELINKYQAYNFTDMVDALLDMKSRLTQLREHYDDYHRSNEI